MEVTLLSSSSPTYFLTADLQSDVGNIARRKRIGCRGWICANATWVRARHAAATSRGKRIGYLHFDTAKWHGVSVLPRTRLVLETGLRKLARSVCSSRNQAYEAHAGLLQSTLHIQSRVRLRIPPRGDKGKLQNPKSKLQKSSNLQRSTAPVIPNSDQRPLHIGAWDFAVPGAAPGGLCL
jgi:hypothetical protein